MDVVCVNVVDAADVDEVIPELGAGTARDQVARLV